MSDGAFAKTFEMHPNPPAPMAWSAYEARVRQEWGTLLNSPAGCDERRIHIFLTNHPSLVPGALSMTGPSGHAPFANALITEAPLAGIGKRVPDFIWLANDSANFTPVFIEIESPYKRWFTEAGVPDHRLTQAMNQLAEWRSWLNRPENVSIFYENFKIPNDLRRFRSFKPEFVLIYGRRAEFEEKPNLRSLRHQFERAGQVVMTFDRLAPEQKCSDFICATKTGDRYRAFVGASDCPIRTDVCGFVVIIRQYPRSCTVQFMDYRCKESFSGREDCILERMDS
jgi:hypothetical protein